MSKKTSTKLVLIIVVSLIDEAVILAAVILVLSLFGIEIPLWSIVTLALIFLAVVFVLYRVLSKKPQLGFENMIGRIGLAISPIAPKGTVRIGPELWQAVSSGKGIEEGVEIIVVGQTGLRLTVIRKNQEEQSDQNAPATSSEATT